MHAAHIAIFFFLKECYGHIVRCPFFKWVMQAQGHKLGKRKRRSCASGRIEPGSVSLHDRHNVPVTPYLFTCHF
jgi:hypothetical protein